MATFSDSDGEEEEQDIQMGDESYRGPPVQGFDDSQGAGIASFKAGTNLQPSGPADFSFLLGKAQEARSTPLPASPLSNSSEGVGGYGDSGGVLKRCRSKGDQDMWVDTKRLAVQGLQPPAPPLRPQ